MTPEKVAQLIVKVAQQDDRAAFEEIYTCFNTRLFLKVYPRVNHVQDTEDIVLDTFMNAYQAIRFGKYDEQGKFWYWLCKIADNEVKKKSKKTIAAGRDVDIISIEKPIDASIENSATLGEQIAIREPEPSIDAEIKERNERLMSLLKGLSRRYSDVLELYMKGFPPKDIASSLDISVDAVRKRIKRGIAHLRARLSKDPYFKEYYAEK